MNTRLKLLLVAIVPMLLSLMVTYYFVKSGYQVLSDNSASTLQNFLIAYKKRELRNYISLAVSSIDHLYAPSSEDNTVAQSLASNILDKMSYNGEDGYFFVYDSQGNSISHPKQSFRIGKNWWDLEDPNGSKIIQMLIKNAKNGGGYHRYQWDKPSKNQLSDKLSYSLFLEKWDWMIGTGIYLDDANQQVATLQEKINGHIYKTEKILLSVATIAIFIISIIGLVLNLSSRKHSNLQIERLAQRMISREEEERRRMSRELHDGIIQILVSIKYSLESTDMALTKSMQTPPPTLERASSNLDSAITEIRRISHNLHPMILDELGLGTAIEAMVRKFSRRTGIETDVSVPAVKKVLADEISITLYRVVQEALTNIDKHADATKVKISIMIRKRWLFLTIADNGKGFKTDDNKRGPLDGIGLRNLRERVEFEHGKFEVKSSNHGTIIKAQLPIGHMGKQKGSAV